ERVLSRPRRGRPPQELPRCEALQAAQTMALDVTRCAMLKELIEAYERERDARVAATVRAAAERVPAFAARLQAAGVETVNGVADLARLPVLQKDQLHGAQRAALPFGGVVAPDAAVRKIFCSPGPLYEPQLAGIDPWRWRTGLAAVGIGPGDR